MFVYVKLEVPAIQTMWNYLVAGNSFWEFAGNIDFGIIHMRMMIEAKTAGDSIMAKKL